jgi:hypothetical protein
VVRKRSEISVDYAVPFDKLRAHRRRRQALVIAEPLTEQEILGTS